MMMAFICFPFNFYHILDALPEFSFFMLMWDTAHAGFLSPLNVERTLIFLKEADN